MARIEIDVARRAGAFALEAAFSSEAPMQGGGHDPVRNGFNFQALEMALGASVELASKSGRRTIALERFITGVRRTCASGSTTSRRRRA